jgi:coatomer subunit zeta
MLKRCESSQTFHFIHDVLSSITSNDSFLQLPPLLPKIDAILVLGNDGDRLAGKYYGDFLKANEDHPNIEESRANFEKEVQQKISGVVARPDAAEVVIVQGKTVVFCGGSTQGGGGDVRVVHVGPSNESELVLAFLCEGMYDALSKLMGGTTERTMVLDNLELVFLLIDEHCDGGVILETDGSKLAGAVLLRDDDGMHDSNAQVTAGHAQTPGMPAGVSTGDMTMRQAFRQVREQFFSSGM